MATEAFRSGFSIYTSRVIDAFMAASVGDTLTRDQLTAIAKIEVASQGKGASAVRSAIKYCERQGRVWRWVRANQVFKYLNESGTTQDMVSRNGKAMRHANRTLRIAATVDRSKLQSLEDQRAYDVAVLQAAMTKTANGTPMRKKLESRQDLEKLSQPTPDQIAGLWNKNADDQSKML